MIIMHGIDHASGLCAAAADNLVRNGFAEYLNVESKTIEVLKKAKRKNKSANEQEGGQSEKVWRRRPKLIITLKKAKDFDEKIN